MSRFIFSQEGMVTNPAIWLVLSLVRISYLWPQSQVMAGNSMGEIVVLVNMTLGLLWIWKELLLNNSEIYYFVKKKIKEPLGNNLLRWLGKVS